MGASEAEAETIVLKFHLYGWHASARQLKQTSVNAEGANGGLLACVDEVVNQCLVCQAFGGPPHMPAAGTSASAFNGKTQVDLCLYDNIILRAKDLFSTCSLIARVCSKNRYAVFAGSREVR